jgi:hypothetical protein
MQNKIITAGLMVLIACVTIAIYNGHPKATMPTYIGENYVQVLSPEALPMVKLVVDSVMFPDTERFIDQFKGYVHITYARPRGRIVGVDNGTAFSDEQLVAIEKFGRELKLKLLIDGKPIQTASPAARPEGPRRYNPRKPGPGDLKVPETMEVVIPRRPNVPLPVPTPAKVALH